ALACELERSDLHDDRHGLEHEKPANDGKHQFMLCSNGDCAQRTAESERARVAHEHHGRRRVIPEETKPRTNQRTAEDCKFTCTGHEVNLEIIRKDRIADEINDETKRSRGNHHRHNGEPVEPIREIDGIGGADNHQRAEQEEEPSKLDKQRLEERHGKRCLQRLTRHEHQRPHGNKGDDELKKKLHTARHTLRRNLRDFEIVIRKAHRAEAERHEENDPDIRIFEIRPKQDGRHEPHQNKEATHGGRTLLLDHMRLRAVFTNRLATPLLCLQQRDKPRPEEKADEKRRYRRTARAKCDVAKDIQRRNVTCHASEPVVKHQFSPLLRRMLSPSSSPSPRSISTSGPMREPREPFTMTTSPGSTASRSTSPSSADVSA